MRGHRGAIRVASEPGRGTTFRVLLPATAGGGVPVAASAELNAEWRGSGTVLVVDDDPAVLAVTVRALALFGFDVIQATDGAAGVEAFARTSDIRCVLLDMTMPRLNGAEAFEAIQRLRPGVPVILMSGYSEQEAAAQFGVGGLAGFVQKPYDLRTLRELLRATLG
jgi:DNA-binding NtrC family response regulator